MWVNRNTFVFNPAGGDPPKCELYPDDTTMAVYACQARPAPNVSRMSREDTDKRVVLC